MSDYALEFFQISARLAGTAFEGLTSGAGGSLVVLSLCAVLAALIATRGSATAEVAAVLPSAPSAPWSGAPEAAAAAIAEDSLSPAAQAVLAVETPGGGE